MQPLNRWYCLIRQFVSRDGSIHTLDFIGGQARFFQWPSGKRQFSAIQGLAMINRKLIAGSLVALLALSNATWAEDSATTQSFVTRSDGKLMVDGKPFRFSGANLDWLVLANDEFAHLGKNLGSATNSYYPSKWMIDDAFATLVKDDPTILCWESANEFASPPEWEREMAVYIKSLDPTREEPPDR